VDPVIEATDIIATWGEVEHRRGTQALNELWSHRHGLRCLFGFHQRLQRIHQETLHNRGRFYRAVADLRRGRVELATEILQEAVDNRNRLIPMLRQGDEDLDLMPHQGAARKAENERERYQRVIRALS